jgi:phytoene dehydrogenase-like protein
VHPLGIGSPFLRSLPLAEHGLEWLHPEIAMAHPMDDGTAVVMQRSLAATVGGLGRDGEAYRRLMEPIVEGWHDLAPAILGPLTRFPTHPLLMARFGLPALLSARKLARTLFKDERTRALIAGISAHANVRLEAPFTASFALVLGGAAHAVGWPVARGGSQAIADSLASYLRSLGGEIVCNTRVAKLSELPDHDVALFDTTPRQVARIAGGSLTDDYLSRLETFRYGNGVYKIDYALDGPIPWRAAECRRAGTVHIGGTLDEIVSSEDDVGRGRVPERPYMIVAQQSIVDPTRAPAGKHTGWAYCHVPHGCTVDMTSRIEAQIERFAPGFRDIVLARHKTGPTELQAYNENYIGGDIGAGAYDGLQMFVRPTARIRPYETSNPRIFICSASTPPGAGVHGMCGYFAAKAALRRL